MYLKKFTPDFLGKKILTEIHLSPVYLLLDVEYSLRALSPPPCPTTASLPLFLQSESLLWVTIKGFE